ncbi:Cell wall synthesis KRE9 [Hyphodiscus hymeniophilus]|uniref:Cell wall synthesis KRE9 n=1 Tax=Hyphodiscus hymeniophilus TaxID=353542 RepID=A0A9P7AVG3_9HELO|nr:Cell wall synthesis KRE9 [Hyphodiscus hymeniophilus]
MRPSSALTFLAAIVPSALAYPEFTIPAPGATVPGGTAFTVTWKDSGDAPALADLSAYQLLLYTGSNTAPQQLYSVDTGSFTSGNTLTVTVPVGTGGSTKNAYFLGIISTATAGGTVTSYSGRFTLTGMTGVFSAAVTTALTTVVGNTGPAAVNNVAAAPAAGSGTLDAGIYGTPYNEQTGLTKYAPMQPIPPTAITATNTSPLWPTSSVSLASTFLPIPTIATTITQSGTFSVSSHANTASAAAQPSNDMQRFLNRWKD